MLSALFILADCLPSNTCVVDDVPVQENLDLSQVMLLRLLLLHYDLFSIHVNVAFSKISKCVFYQFKIIYRIYTVYQRGNLIVDLIIDSDQKHSLDILVSDWNLVTILDVLKIIFHKKYSFLEG